MIEISIDLNSFWPAVKLVSLYLGIGSAFYLFASNSKFYREIQTEITFEQLVKKGISRLEAEIIAERYVETDFVRFLFLWPLWVIAVLAVLFNKLKTKNHD
jgi:hypothetical protein